MARHHFCVLTLGLLLGTAAAGPAEPPPVRVFFGPKSADDPEGLYFNLMRFLDSAEQSLYGCLHEVDMISVADRLARRAAAGVDVQLVVEADWWHLSKNKAARQVLEQSKVRIVLDNRKSGLLHNKFFIADRRRVWTGSTNITETCLLYNPNNAVWLESEPVAQNYITEFEEEREGRFGKRGSGPPNTPFPSVQVGPTRVRTFFSPEDEPLPEIVKVIDGAKKSVEVMCFVLSSEEVGKALIRAHGRGARVRVLLDNRFSSPGSTARWPYVPFHALKKAGVACKYDDEDAKLHHKVVIADGATVVTGSFNLSLSAALENDENALILDSAELAGQYQREFERLWKFYPGDPGRPPPDTSDDVDR